MVPDPDFIKPFVAGLLFHSRIANWLGGGNVGGFLRDDRLLQGDLRIEIAHRGFSPRDVGVGLIERGSEIAIVNPGQHLSRFYRLVVADQDFREIAGHFRRNDRGVGFDIGVIGRFQVPPGGEVAVPEVRGTGERRRPVPAPERRA